MLRIKAVLGVMMAASLLAACSSFPGSQDVSPATPEPPPPEPKKVDPPKLVKKPVRADSRKLLDKTPADVHALLGTPSLLRRDGNVQTALYEHASCILDLTYFSDGYGRGFTLGYLAARTPLGVDVEADDCLTDLLPKGEIPEALQAAPVPVVRPDAQPSIAGDDQSATEQPSTRPDPDTEGGTSGNG